MKVTLGVDTLSYHCRLVAGDVTLTEVVEDAADLGFEFVQLNAVHFRDHSDTQLDALLRRAEGLGLRLALAGDVVGVAARGDTVEDGASRVRGWIAQAQRIGSPYARMSSGFYRAELAGRPELIRAEQDYLIRALSLAADSNDSGVQILLENHSDFTPEEYVGIVDAVGHERVGVFLDVINPISVMADPLSTVELLFPWAPAGHVKDYRMESRYVADGFHRRGFEIQWCYPGEGVADLPALLGVIAGSDRGGEYLLSIEGLDNRERVADQRPRLTASRDLLRGLVGTREAAA
ncbi:MAG: hypothetical protein BGO95_04570 [Micrococcales bacterium 73-13]|nr:MAG: hypothetical protein BGO95_04570 [Micrococcales bacterium 73-13]